MNTDGWIDTHCHLDAFLRAGDLERVISDAHAQGIRGWIVPGVEPGNWSRVRAVCASTRGAAFALGIHPWWSHVCRGEALEALENAVGEAIRRHEPIVAIGECGLDRLRGASRAQEEGLLAQISLANQFGLPVILHCVRRHGRLLELLSRCPPEYGFVVHAFSGSAEVALGYVSLGGYIGLGGLLEDRKAEKWLAVLRSVPKERILVETDAPDMKAAAWPGRRNEPANLARVVERLEALESQTTGEPDLDWKCILSSNTCHLFSRYGAIQVEKR
ncbi:TatD family hydrolase [Hahella sp. SMD15-11]|uniref:TatD family hydrolase n=1 Tax=Thermohahella caldifontis TaxID=3142973 RepID=A0AB39UWH6_9GAMM